MLHGHALPGEGGVEHGLGDRAGEATAGAGGDLLVGALEHHGDGVAGRVGRGEGDDPGVRPLRLARVVELGGAGLGGDGDPAVEGDAAARRARSRRR